ncbi:MAG TPA: YihY/virulence factor BrkB family protein [Ignavibacteriaceae bacterium]|nr:YihY/virulence factor BrkB family protein [Ignavibacteriaceae bacterium]
MKLRFKSSWEFLIEVVEKFIEDNVPKLGAALSFYTIFSMAPLLIVIVSLAGIFYGDAAAQGRIISEIQDYVGREGAAIIQTALKNASYEYTGLIPIIVSAITILIGSTIVFVDIQESLNIIWKVKPKSERGMVKGFLNDRLISFVMVLGTGLLLLATMIISTIISSLNDFISEKFFNVPVAALQNLNLIISFGVIFVLFMVVYKFLPNVHIRWKHVWAGALVTSILFVLGQYLIGLYIGKSSLSSTYGAAGSLVIFLLWIYYSSQILFLGAEFISVYVKKSGDVILPKNKFVKFSESSINLEEIKEPPLKNRSG